MPTEDDPTVVKALQQKIARNINIEVKKAKIILFSELGFDIVIKARRVHIVNSKQSVFTKEIRDLERDEFEQCESVSYCCLDSIDRQHRRA